MTEQLTSEASPQRRSWLIVLPLIVFLALAALFLFRLAMAIRREFPPP